MNTRHRRAGQPPDDADRAALGRAAIDDLAAILTILDEAEATTPSMSSSLVLSRVTREIREVIGGPEVQPAGSLWRRVLDLSCDDQETTR